jgi:hypothetical protein
MGVTDIVWLRYASNQADCGAPDRAAVVAHIQGRQEAGSGLVCHAPRDGHSNGHAFWQTVRALRILGADILHFPKHLRPMCTPAGLQAWFDGFDWDGQQGERPGNHHELLGLIPIVVSLGDREMTDTVFRNLAAQQNTVTGTWPRSQTNISRSFAYTALHLSAGRIPGMPERIVDEFLRLQMDSGLWDKNLPHFATMDSVYVLARLPKRLGYREADATTALRRTAKALREVYVWEQEKILAHTHRTLAVTHTFGLLQEAFPEEFPSERPYRFDWDRLDLYDSGTIRKGIGR